MKSWKLLVAFITILLNYGELSAQVSKAPAYPLITHSPYFSIWSFTDTVNASTTRHWTGADNPLNLKVNVDGHEYALIGKGNGVSAIQKKVEITATQTTYQFDCGQLNVQVKFTSPLIITDLAISSRPISYTTIQATSKDGKTHKAQFSFSGSTNFVVHAPGQAVDAQQYNIDGLTVLKAGSVEQPILKRAGDDVRIDWGYGYIATNSKNAHQSITKNQNNPSVLELNTFFKEELIGSKEITHTLLTIPTIPVRLQPQRPCKHCTDLMRPSALRY